MDDDRAVRAGQHLTTVGGTDRLRVWRTRPTGSKLWGPWEISESLPEESPGVFEVQVAWALIAPEPTEAAGRPPSPGDQLIGFLEGHQASLSIGPSDGIRIKGEQPPGEFSAMLIWGREAPDSPMAGASAVASGDTVVECIETLLAEAGVGKVGPRGYERVTPIPRPEQSAGLIHPGLRLSAWCTCGDPNLPGRHRKPPQPCYLEAEPDTL